MTTIICIRTEDRVIITGDTRLSTSSRIVSDGYKKVKKYPSFLVGVAGDPAVMTMFDEFNDYVEARKSLDEDDFQIGTIAHMDDDLEDADYEYLPPVRITPSSIQEFFLEYRIANITTSSLFKDRDNGFEALLTIPGADTIYMITFGEDTGLQIVEISGQYCAVGSGADLARVLFKYVKKKRVKIEDIYEAISAVDPCTGTECISIGCPRNTLIPDEMKAKTHG